MVVGDEQPAAVHALAHAINQALGNVGRTVECIEPVEAGTADQASSSLQQLASDMEAGRVETLIVVESNPVYTAPADLKFDDRLMGRVPLRIHLGLHHDETAALCHWHIPAAHYLESWSDVRAADGTVSLIQPLVAPLYNGRTAHEVLGAMASKQAGQAGYEVVRGYWPAAERPAGRGVRRGSGASPCTTGSSRTRAAAVKTVAGRPVDGPRRSPGRKGTRDRVPSQTPTVFDGRFANNGWLQELPKPNTSLTWDNAALMSPATAERFGVERGEVVELAYRGRRMRAPVWILPGQAPDSITVHLGYGRARAGHVGTGAGFQRLCPPHQPVPLVRARLVVQAGRVSATNSRPRRTIRRWRGARS